MKAFRRMALLGCVLALCTGAIGQTLGAAGGGNEARVYLYGGRSAIYTNNIKRTHGAVDVVLADYFEITADGSVKMTHTPDSLFIQARQAEGYKVLAYVSNHWSQSAGIAAMHKRDAVTAALASWAQSYGLDGIDVDIENLTANERDLFTDFCRLLRQRLPDSKQLSVAVAPNPWGVKTGWQGQYDYHALGSICDAVLLMTYDQSYQGGEAGPVASYDFAERSVKQALEKDRIPAEKLYLGMPFYGRYWVTYASGGKDKGKAFTMSDVEAIVAHYPSTAWYDAVNHCARARVTVGANDPGIALWGGKKPAAGVYDIWYENERSLRTRMELVRKYKIAGVGAWALGQEPERVWSSFRSWLRSLPFDDIAGHWAETELCELHDAGLIQGVGEGRFAPNDSISRAEVCVLLCKLLQMPPLTPPAGAPAEIRNHWAAGYLWRAVSAGLLQGDGTGYHPSRRVSREEMAAFCERVMNVPNTIDFNERHFSDVLPDMWSNKAVVTAYIHGVMKGRGDGQFHPHDDCSRAEAAVTIRRLMDTEKKAPNNAAARRMPMEKKPLEPR